MNEICGACARFILQCGECQSGWCDAMGESVDSGDKACADFYAEPVDNNKQGLNDE